MKDSRQPLKHWDFFGKYAAFTYVGECPHCDTVGHYNFIRDTSDGGETWTTLAEDCITCGATVVTPEPERT